MTYEYCRKSCRECVHFASNGVDYAPCAKQGVDVHNSNNICRSFESRIKNPSAPEFDFDDYLTWLGSDYYRPYTINRDKIIGSARLGEVIADKGKLAENIPSVYSPFYETIDRPWCKARMPDCFVRVGGQFFDVDYVRYRECRTIENGAIKFRERRWKETPKARKFKREINGEWEVD